jgi:hypothetical protein
MKTSDPDEVLKRVFPVIEFGLPAEDIAALLRARYIRRRDDWYVWTKRGVEVADAFDAAERS